MYLVLESMLRGAFLAHGWENLFCPFTIRGPKQWKSDRTPKETVRLERCGSLRLKCSLYSSIYHLSARECTWKTELKLEKKAKSVSSYLTYA